MHGFLLGLENVILTKVVSDARMVSLARPCEPGEDADVLLPPELPYVQASSK
jgi:hypothetical protein